MPTATGMSRHAEQFQRLACIDAGAIGGEIAAHGRDGFYLQFWALERKENCHRVVDAGITVENNSFHGVVSPFVLC